MKKVLLISYFFPPVGGGGVIRITKFAKFLPQFGWQPFILTVKKAFYPFYDAELLNELPLEVQIEQISYIEPAFWIANKWWQSFLAYIIYPLFLIPDRQILWLIPAVLSARRIIKKEKIKLIFTSSTPATNHLIGWILKKLTKVKWVADFRDEWSNNPLGKFPTPVHRWVNQFLEKKVVGSADKITSVSEPLTRYLKNLGPKKEKFTTIINGFDSEDFQENKPFSKRGKYFQIVYSGTLYNSKIAQPFLDAARELNFPDLKVTFIGQVKRVSHRRSIKIIQDADILLLILDPIERSAVMTGKLYEYLAARKPILALAPENSGAARLIKKLKVGRVVPTLAKEKIKVAIDYFYRRFKKEILSVPEINLDQFERKNLTKNLARIFDGLSRNRRIKLCLIGNIYSPQNRDLLKFFKLKNYEIHFISTTEGRFRGVKSYYLGPVGSTSIYFIRSVLKIRHWLRQIKPDIVHGQDLVFAGIWGYLSSSHPLVVTTWGSDIFGYQHFIRIEQYFVRKTLQAADLVTGPSLALAKAAEKIGLQKNKFQLVHFGIDLNIFRKFNVTDLKAKPQFQDKKVIFCPRAIAPIYNTDILIEAFRILNSRKNYKLILLEHNVNKDYLLKIEKLIIKYDLVDDVIFLPKLNSISMANYYNLAEVAVSLASSDGCPRSFLEALGCEKRIVITKLPFTQEWGTDFWMVPIRDVKKTVQTIEKALKYPNKRFSKIGQTNRQLVAERAEIKSNFEKLAKLYRELL